MSKPLTLNDSFPYTSFCGFSTFLTVAGIVHVYVDRSQVSFVPPAEVDTEVRSGQFVGPIQYRIWKHMKNCLYPSMLNYAKRFVGG